jgi:hypothetical protein
VIVLTVLAEGVASADQAAQRPPDPAALELASEPLAPDFLEPSFGPRYVIENVIVRGNTKTESSLILGEIGLRPGDQVAASDSRVEAARFRLLSLGYFLDVRLSLKRGTQRGGAVLLVEIEERGTIVINELFLSTSDATAFWGGIDVAETNFLGHGINLGGGFVTSTEPVVEGAESALGLRLHGSVPELRGPGISLSGTGLYNDGSEFFRASGDDQDPDPTHFVAVRTRRGGGILGAGKILSRSIRVFADFRQEVVSATFPALRTRQLAGLGSEPIDFAVREGFSRLASVTGTIDLDTRSDPVLPRTGYRLALSLEVAHGALASSYPFAKALLQGSLYHRIASGHVLGFHALGGAIFGDAPYFDRFFVGDLNPLLPRRALGINFSTLPARNILGLGITKHRYDDYAARLLVDYAVPLWRRRGFVYRGDAFAAIGVLGLASDRDFEGPQPFSWQEAPIDLTADLGLRLDTYVGVFTISIANALSRSSF